MVIKFDISCCSSELNNKRIIQKAICWVAIRNSCPHDGHVKRGEELEDCPSEAALCFSYRSCKQGIILGVEPMSIKPGTGSGFISED